MRSAEQVERVRRLAAAVLNQSAIARTTGIPRSTLRYWLGNGRRRSSMCCVCAGDPDRLPGHDYTYLLGLYLGNGGSCFRIRALFCAACCTPTDAAC